MSLTTVIKVWPHVFDRYYFSISIGEYILHSKADYNKPCEALINGIMAVELLQLPYEIDLGAIA